MVWRHQEQLSWDEIGRRMGCTADAARKVWSRAIQQLRRELAEHESIRMNGSEGEQPEVSLADALAAYDDRLAAGIENAPAEPRSRPSTPPCSRN